MIQLLEGIHRQHRAVCKQRTLYLQASYSEDGDQRNLLSAAKIQASNDWDWKYNYREVRYNVYACIGAMRIVSFHTIVWL
jgi:hypothetical protein